MPLKNSVWDIAAMKSLVAEWYGMREMPMRILSREDEIEQFEKEHTEVPVCLWEYVNHDVRLLRMWAREELCVDLLVWDETTQSVRLVQDICFKDAYPDAAAWHQAVFQLVKSSSRVWVVFHQ